MRFSVLLLLPLLAAAAARIDAQVPAPRASPKPKGPEPLKGMSDEIKVRAEKSGAEHGHAWWEGFVDLQSGDIRIQSDYMEVNEIDKPDGTKQRLVHAQGNVVFLRGEERLAGDTLDLDLDSNFATFTNASGYVQPGVFLEAKKIERVDADTYRIEGGKFTSCAQPNPRWGFTASRATVDVDDKITAQNVFFKIKSVPALYFPYFYYPIKEDHRATGILMPHIGFSSTRGFNLGDGFFWAMSRNTDQTFYVDHYSKVGWGFGHEFRYALDSPSRGTFTTYLFNPQSSSLTDYDLNWNLMQSLPGRFRMTGLVRKYSSISFQQQFQDNFNLATNRTQHATLNIQGPVFGRNGAQLQLTADSTDTYFGEIPEIMRRLPSLTLSRSGRRIGRSQFVFGYTARAENFGRNNDEVLDYWGRVDLAPELSRSFSNSFLQVTPRVRPRYTWYSGTLDDVGLTTEPAKSRPLMETGLEVRGPQFSRVFGGPGFYTDKIKHVIGPEVTWTYRTKVTDFDKIPKFDGYDQMLGTNQVDYALVNTLYAKRPSGGASGKLTPYQFLTWRIQQSYYVQISDNQQEFDPNYSTVYYGPGGVPTHLSPLQSRLRFRPTPPFALSYDTEYDINFHETRSKSIYGTIATSWLSFSGGWSVTNNVSRKVEKRVATSNGVRGQLSLKLPFKFAVDGWSTYDFIQKEFLQSQARLRLESQCCGFSVEVIRYKYNNRDEQQIRFSIDLANIGSIGNFMGQGTGVPNQGLAGFR